MPWHDMSDGDALALVHQEDGRHLHSAPHRSPDWASERWWLREDGFEFPGARQLGNRPIRPRASPTSKVRKTLDTTLFLELNIPCGGLKRLIYSRKPNCPRADDPD